MPIRKVGSGFHFYDQKTFCAQVFNLSDGFDQHDRLRNSVSDFAAL